jgi:hypothetical protein
MNRLDRYSLLADPRRNSWIMTIPSAYFVSEYDCDVVPLACENCVVDRRRLSERANPRRHLLDAFLICAGVATLGGISFGLWWGLETALELIPLFR